MSYNQKINSIQRRVEKFIGGSAYDILDDVARQDLREALAHLKAIAQFANSEKVRLQATELQLAYFLGRPINRQEIMATTQQNTSQVPLARYSEPALAAVRLIKEETERLMQEDAGGEVLNAPISALPPLPPRK